MVGQVDAVVVGAGVVGIAIARALAMKGLTTFLLEAEPQFGTVTSSRNSEVIHAGIYYPQDSLKARLCVRGRDLLYQFCEARQIAHKRLGKLIFAATTDQIRTLDDIESAACSAGVNDLNRLSRLQVASLEPHLKCEEALLSPSTGIVDSHAFMTAMLSDFLTYDGLLICNTKVERISNVNNCWGIHIHGNEDTAVSSPILVNAAGLNAQRLSQATNGMVADLIPPLYLARGTYFTCIGKVPFRHLIYPVPVPGGLGTHLTLDLAGYGKFGPDVEWIGDVDYSINDARLPTFLDAARKIWPELEADRLQPGYCGIRPKLSGPGEPPTDFVISGPADHGLEGLVNLFGIESPGLTASLAIAENVIDRLF